MYLPISEHVRMVRIQVHLCIHEPLVTFRDHTCLLVIHELGPNSPHTSLNLNYTAIIYIT